MKINCENGFYKFYPEGSEELNIFADRFGVELVRMGDFFTFPALAALPDYSIEGQLFGGIVASINYAAAPWVVFARNRLKYDLENGIIISSDKIDTVGERSTGYNWVVTGIVPAFAQLNDKTIISGFNGFYNVIEDYTLVYRWENADI